MPSTVGNQLRQARLARGLTIEQVSHATRIRTHYLEALERDDRSILPSPVQGRGFLRLYAGHLNLAAEDLINQWEGRAQAPLPPSPEAQAQSSADLLDQPILASPVENKSIPLQNPDLDLSQPVSRAWADQTTTAQSIFVEIGQTLRNQREILSLSLDDVERFTHLRLRYLIALEAGALDQLPSPVQARGMLSNYATFLNMDSEKILLRFADGLQTRRSERLAPPEPGTKPTPRGAKPASPIRRLVTPDLLFAIVLLSSLFGLILWGAASIGIGNGEESVATLPSVGEVLLITPSITPPEQSILIEGTPETALPTEPVVATIQPIITIASINSDPLQVYVVARRRAFLRIIVDGELKYNGRIIPGNAYPYSGKQRIELICGNAAAIQVFHNQQDLGSLGTSGQPVSLIFTASGIVTPTLSITLLPTFTLPATVTPQASPTAPTSTITPLIP